MHTLPTGDNYLEILPAGYRYLDTQPAEPQDKQKLWHPRGPVDRA